MRLLRSGGLLAALLVLAPAAPAAALQAPAGSSAGPILAQGTVLAPPVAQRLGRGRGVFRPRVRPRTGPGLRPRRIRPAPSLRRIGGGILRFLGIAYLVNLLFGWGGGGSPLGLLLVGGLVAWLVLRRRRRVVYLSRS